MSSLRDRLEKIQLKEEWIVQEKYNRKYSNIFEKMEKIMNYEKQNNPRLDRKGKGEKLRQLSGLTGLNLKYLSHVLNLRDLQVPKKERRGIRKKYGAEITEIIKKVVEIYGYQYAELLICGIKRMVSELIQAKLIECNTTQIKLIE